MSAAAVVADAHQTQSANISSNRDATAARVCSANANSCNQVRPCPLLVCRPLVVVVSLSLVWPDLAWGERWEWPAGPLCAARDGATGTRPGCFSFCSQQSHAHKAVSRDQVPWAWNARHSDPAGCGLDATATLPSSSSFPVQMLSASDLTCQPGATERLAEDSVQRGVGEHVLWTSFWAMDRWLGTVPLCTSHRR